MFFLVVVGVFDAVCRVTAPGWRGRADWLPAHEATSRVGDIDAYRNGLLIEKIKIILAVTFAIQFFTSHAYAYINLYSQLPFYAILIQYLIH